MFVTITAPRGITLNPGFDPLVYEQVENGYNISDLVTATPGATNSITFSSTDISSGYVFSSIGDFARFNLVMDCDQLELGGVSGTINIQYETKLVLYDAPNSTNVIFERDIHCGSFEPIIEHSCNPPCQGPNITGLDAYRITAGWETNEMLNKVNLGDLNLDGSPKYELDKYLAGDEMEVTTKGFMHNLTSNNLHFVQDYTTDGLTSGANDIEFVSGTIYFHDSDLNVDTPVLAIDAPTVTSSGNNHTLDYDLSPFINLPGGVIVGDNNVNKDEFFVKFIYKFTTDTYTNYAYHILSGFRGRYYIDETLPGDTTLLENDNNDNGIQNQRLSCFDWGDSVGYLRPNHILNHTATRNFKYCENPWQALYLDYTLAGVGHLHTGEYRPVTMVQDVTVTIPDGLSITDVRAVSNQAPTYFYLSAGALELVSSSGNTNVYRPVIGAGSNYKHLDQTSNAAYRWEFLMKGSCELDLTSQITSLPLNQCMSL